MLVLDAPVLYLKCNKCSGLSAYVGDSRGHLSGAHVDAVFLLAELNGWCRRKNRVDPEGEDEHYCAECSEKLGVKDWGKPSSRSQ